MEKIPRSPRNRRWRPECAVTAGDALESWLDEVERWNDVVATPMAVSTEFPMSSGLLPLDRVLGGGLRRRRVVLLEADRVAHGDALLFTVARSTPQRVLLVGPDLLAMTQRLVAGASGVPEVLLSELDMVKEDDWSSISSAMAVLARLELRLGAVDSLGGVRHLVARESADVVLVHQPDHLGGRAEVLGVLAELAWAGQVAVVTAGPPGGPVHRHRRGEVEHVRVTSLRGGTRAHMVRPDPIDMLSVATAEIDSLVSSAGEVGQ